MLSEKPWRADRAVWLYAAYIAAMVLANIVAIGYKGDTPDKPGNELLVFGVGIFTSHIVTLVLVHIFLQQHRVGWNEAFGFNEPRLGRTLFLGALVSVLILPVGLSLTELVARLLKYFGTEPIVQQPVQMMKQASSTLQLIVHGLAAVIFAPIVEEIIFRGVLYPTVKKYFNPKAGLWGVSLLFALSHQNLTVILPLTVLAIFLTFLYETTRNLLAPILAHSLFNAANFVLLLLQR
jgi:membrane protease YdiL (CAAX protease family)